MTGNFAIRVGLFLALSGCPGLPQLNVQTAPPASTPPPSGGNSPAPPDNPAIPAGREPIETTPTDNESIVDPSFEAIQSVPVGASLTFGTVGDFNEDEASDVAYVNSIDDNMNVVLADGDGGFGNPTPNDNASSSFYITMGDFDDDGHIDIASANFSGNSIAIWKGAGDGNFSRGGLGDFPDISVGSHPAWIATGSLTADDRQDMVVANSGSSNISVLLNQGDGTFLRTDVGTAAVPASVVMEDFDADGFKDIAVANQSGAAVWVFLNNQLGVFSSHTSYAVGSQPSAIIAAKFVGSAFDLVTANFGSDTVSFLAGNGDGTFDAASNTASGPDPLALAALDQDEDGILDIAVVNETHNIRFLFGDGAGAFPTSLDNTVGGDLFGATFSDTDENAKPDLVIFDNQLQQVQIVHSNDDGSLLVDREVTTGLNPAAITIGDFDGDDVSDFITANNGDNNVSVALSNGDKTFSVVEYALNGSSNSPFSIVSADFDGDEQLDLLTGQAGSNDLDLFIGNGDGTFNAASVVSVSGGAVISSPGSIAISDFDGDTTTDLLVLEQGSSSLSILLGDGAGAFSGTDFITGLSLPTAVAVANFDSGETSDFALLNSGATEVQIWLGVGDGTFTQSPSLTLNSSDAPGLATGDFDGDSNVDIATVDSSADLVSVWLGVGDGTFGARTDYDVGESPIAVTATDLQGDGLDDLIVSNQLGRSVTTLISRGTLFDRKIDYSTGMGPMAVGCVDFNQDDKPDIVVVNNSQNNVSVMFQK